MVPNAWHVLLPLLPSLIALFVTAFATRRLVEPLKREVLERFKVLGEESSNAILHVAVDWHLQIAAYSDFILFFPSWYTAVAAFGERWSDTLRLVGWFFFGPLVWVYVVMPIMKSRLGELSLKYTPTADLSKLEKFLNAKSEADFYAKLLIGLHVFLLVGNVASIIAGNHAAPR